MTWRCVGTAVLFWAAGAGAGQAALPPGVYLDARRIAPIHMQVTVEAVAVTSGVCTVTARAGAVFRGPLSPGDGVTITLSCMTPDIEPMPGATLWTNPDAIKPGVVLEGFFAGEGESFAPMRDQVAVVEHLRETPWCSTDRSACDLPDDPAVLAAWAFRASLEPLCGNSYAGKVTASNESDAAFRDNPIVLSVTDCFGGTVRMALSVGEDRTRTWVLTETPAGLRFKHEHVKPDGTPDPVTNYGGDSAPGGSETRQSFPADAESQAMFIAQNIPQAQANVWTLERTGTVLAYALTRPERHFRVEFDLTAPIADGVVAPASPAQPQ